MSGNAHASRFYCGIFFAALIFSGVPAFASERLRVAAASDLRYALNEVIDNFKALHEGTHLEVSYGSSGKFYSQLTQGAPFDVFFSADEAYPQRLHEAGLAHAGPRRYATGRLVLWSKTRDPSRIRLRDLGEASVGKIAIANPAHAPYGARAKEVLENAGVWNNLQGRLLFGENISQAARFAETGGADFALLSLSLVTVPPLSKVGRYELIPADQHQVLHQSLVIMKQSKNAKTASTFADYVLGEAGQKILRKYGFSEP